MATPARKYLVWSFDRKRGGDERPLYLSNINIKYSPFFHLVLFQSLRNTDMFDDAVFDGVLGRPGLFSGPEKGFFTLREPVAS
jgi:hypothetical protein